MDIQRPTRGPILWGHAHRTPTRNSFIAVFDNHTNRQRERQTDNRQGERHIDKKSVQGVVCRIVHMTEWVRTLSCCGQYRFKVAVIDISRHSIACVERTSPSSVSTFTALYWADFWVSTWDQVSKVKGIVPCSHIHRNFAVSPSIWINTSLCHIFIFN